MRRDETTHVAAVGDHGPKGLDAVGKAFGRDVIEDGRVQDLDAGEGEGAGGRGRWGWGKLANAAVRVPPSRC